MTPRVSGAARLSRLVWWVRALSVVSALGLLGACAAPEEDDEGVDGVAALAQPTPTPRTVCFGGRTFGDPYSIGGIRELDDLCRRMPRLIRDESGGRDASYAFFQWSSSLDHVLTVLVSALDTDHDGAITSSDAPVDLTVIDSVPAFDARRFSRSSSRRIVASVYEAWRSPFAPFREIGA